MNNFSLDLDYLFVTILLVFVYYFAGNNISKGDKFWQNSILCVVSMIFAMGVRYGRGYDYLHYIDVYKYNLEDRQLLFHGSIKCLNVSKHNLLRYLLIMLYLSLSSL